MQIAYLKNDGKPIAVAYLGQLDDDPNIAAIQTALTEADLRGLSALFWFDMSTFKTDATITQAFGNTEHTTEYMPKDNDYKYGKLNLRGMHYWQSYYGYYHQVYRLGYDAAANLIDGTLSSFYAYGSTASSGNTGTTGFVFLALWRLNNAYRMHAVYAKYTKVGQFVVSPKVSYDPTTIVSANQPTYEYMSPSKNVEVDVADIDFDIPPTPITPGADLEINKSRWRPIEAEIDESMPDVGNFVNLKFKPQICDVAWWARTSSQYIPKQDTTYTSGDNYKLNVTFKASPSVDPNFSYIDYSTIPPGRSSAISSRYYGAGVSTHGFAGWIHYKDKDGKDVVFFDSLDVSMFEGKIDAFTPVSGNRIQIITELTISFGGPLINQLDYDLQWWHTELINKVVFNGQTLLDLTSDTVTRADVRAGKIFHLPTGEQIDGTMTGGGGGGGDTEPNGIPIPCENDDKVNEYLNEAYMNRVLKFTGSTSEAGYEQGELYLVEPAERDGPRMIVNGVQLKFVEVGEIGDRAIDNIKQLFTVDMFKGVSSLRHLDNLDSGIIKGIFNSDANGQNFTPAAVTYTGDYNTIITFTSGSSKRVYYTAEGNDYSSTISDSAKYKADNDGPTYQYHNTESIFVHGTKGGEEFIYEYDYWNNAGRNGMMQTKMASYVNGVATIDGVSSALERYITYLTRRTTKNYMDNIPKSRGGNKED